RERPLAARGEQTFRSELLLQALERGEVRAEAEALDRQGLEVEVAPLLVQLRASVDVHALTVDEIQPQSVELPPWHLRGEARAAVRILEGEEDGRPALLSPQFGDLAFDPQRRQLLEVAGDAQI